MNKILSFILLFCFISCNKTNKVAVKQINITKVQILEKEFDFGNASLNDTIVHTFNIKNITTQNLILKKVATSCGCTTFGDLDSIANKDESISINVKYIPKKNELGEVSNSLGVEMNTEPAFIIFKLKGNIVN